MLECGTPPPSLPERAQILIRWLQSSPTVRGWYMSEGKTPHQLEELEIELIRWKEAGYPHPQQWPLSPLCLSELGLVDKAPAGGVLI